MLYQILFFPARLFLRFYCKKVTVNNRAYLQKKGPLLIAANHPNSFLDAIIVASLFQRPVHSLARGDVFRGRFISRILKSLKMLPVYRISEGAENLGHNYTTFESCREIFQKKGIVLIFSEGRCINEWRLRPLKKGTARIALAAWERGDPLEVLPLGINYSSFRKFGKNLVLNFGHPMDSGIITSPASHGKAIQQFNEVLHRELKNQTYEISQDDVERRRALFDEGSSNLKRVLNFLPAMAGGMIHLPLYAGIDLLIRKRANDHYDSIVVGLLFFFYPLYVLALTWLVYYLTGSLWALLLMLVIPATAIAYLHSKNTIG